MKWFKRSKKRDCGEACFRERVEDFWRWWSSESERILKSVDADGGNSIQPEVSEQVSRLGSGLAWVFGPAPDGVGHSFTISPEADAHKRFLVRHWFSKAPELEGWTFYPARQPSYDFGGHRISLRDSGVEVGADSIWITPSVDIENEDIDIKVWSPAFADIEHKHAMQILFLFLDEALGEEGVECCIGAIDVGDDKLDRSFPLTELPDFVDSVFEEQGWSQDLMEWCTFEVAEIAGDFPRGDIFVGSTQHLKLLNEYSREQGPIENPIAGSGAEFVFLQLPAAILPEGEEVDFRCGIADAIVEKFEAEDSGMEVGGAMGRHAAYIDLLLLDPVRGRRAIDEVIAERGLADQLQIFPFTK